MAESGQPWTAQGQRTRERGGALVNDPLTEALRLLRTRAGSPTYRDLERLTGQQGHRMSRASIQDKFAGNSSLKLVQALTLVRACAEYARSIGAPLPPEDLDENSWRERAAKADSTATVGTNQSPTTHVSTDSRLNRTKEIPELESLIPPLLHAGMEDIADLVKQGRGQSLESWLPAALVELDSAQMDYQGFLNLAAHASPGQTIKILQAISEAESENAGNRYFQTCLLTQPPSEIPKLLVALRRHNGDFSFWYTQHFVDAILGLGDWPGGPRRDLAEVLQALRSATLSEDANNLAENIGLHAWPRIALATAGAISSEFMGDRERILFAASRGGSKRLIRLINYLNKEEIPGISPKATVEALLSSTPAGSHAKYSLALDEAGLKAEAERLRDLEKSAPF